MLITDGYADGSTITTSLIVVLSSTANPSASVQVTVPADSAQDHPSPVALTNVKELGSTSVTVTGPGSSVGPALRTASVYVASCPTVIGSWCRLVIDRSTRAGTSTGSVQVLLESSLSAVDDVTSAVLSADGKAAGCTSTVRVIGGASVSGPSGPASRR